MQNKTVMLTLRCRKEQRAAAKRYAASQGVSLSVIILALLADAQARKLSITSSVVSIGR